MNQKTTRFSTFISLSGIEYPEEIDLGLVGCYSYHNAELIDVLVLSDTDQKLLVKNLSSNDTLRFECKLLGTRQRFLGSVSFKAEKLLAIDPGESWSQLFPLFDEGEPDECKKDFGEAKVAPPWILLTFQPTEFSSSGISTEVKQTTKQVTKKSTKSESKVGSEQKSKTKKGDSTKQKQKPKEAEKQEEESGTLEDKVVLRINKLADSMDHLQANDRNVIAGLDTIDAHNEQLGPRHEQEEAKLTETEEILKDLTQVIDEMKEQDKVDVDELGQSKQQLFSDVNAAGDDFEALQNETKKLNDYISQVSGENYDSDKGTVASKQKAIRKFLISTLSRKDPNSDLTPLYKENEIFRKKGALLREQVKNKFLNNDGLSDDEINKLCTKYEALLDKHADIFKQLDDKANLSLDEFDKHGDLWKHLFTEGMLLEKNCDDTDYQLEELTDQENQLRKMKGDLEGAYGDYVGKIRYVTEQQKGIIDELKNDISNMKNDISSLKRQLDNATSDLTIESKAYARGRNTKNDPSLEGVMSDFVAVHQERRRAQDDGEGLHDVWVAANKDFLDRAHSEFEISQRDKGTILRIQEIMDQISQSNQEIDRILADMQRLEREVGVSKQKGTLWSDMGSDLSDLRSRLDEELSKRERVIVCLKEHAFLQRNKSDTYARQLDEINALLRDIEELRIFLRERYYDEEAELIELNKEIEIHKDRLRTIINEINELRILIVEEEHHNDIKRNLLRNRDEYIERLKIAIGGLNVKPPPKVEYIITPGDDLDALLAAKLKEYGLNIPLTRLGGGFYLFGTRKIFAKILNGKLVVRVGGGYMNIDEFLATYSDMELIRINKMMENEGVDVYEELKVYKKYLSENPEAFKKIDPNRRTLIKSPKNKPKPSERGRF